MRIDRLVLESFGAFTGAGFTFAPGLNLFFGQNEEGKSTLIDGLLLALLGAPANSAHRQRYAPLDGRAYRTTVFFTASTGLSFRLERDLGPDGHERVYLREGDTWLGGRRAAAALKELGLPSFDLARATAVVSGSEVVLAEKEAGAIGRAISARATSERGAVTGQGAKNRLEERRRALARERRELEERLRVLRAKAAELRAAEEMRRALESARQEAGARLEEARALHAAYGLAIAAMTALIEARKAYEGAAARHGAVFADLRAIRAKEEEIALLERELAPFLPQAELFGGSSTARLRHLAGIVAARRETAAQNAAEASRLEGELAVLRERLDLARRAGFTPERQRELDRIEAAVDLAQKDLAEKEAALAALAEERMSPVPLAGGGLILAGLGIGLMARRFWWGGAALVLLAVGLAVCWLFARRRRAARKEALLRAREEARKGSDLARTALLSLSGGREMPAWQEEYAAVRRLEEDIREKEARLVALSGLAGGAEAEEAEFVALLTAAGCGSVEEFEARAARFEELRRRLAELKAARDSLLRGKDVRAWEEEELALAREEAAARAALLAAEEKAAGLDPAAVARYREELAACDLAALERRYAEAASAYEQHLKSAMTDAWEVETGLALAEEALIRNGRRIEAIRLAVEVLEEAIAEVQASLVPRIRERASGFFAALTGGRYDGLELVSGAEMLEVLPLREGRPLPGRILSSGTADQMYLALRLALLEALEGPEPFPLILDDPFLTFDRARLERAAALLKELAEGRQIVLVTKDDFLRDLVSTLGAQVVEDLASPVPLSGSGREG